MIYLWPDYKHKMYLFLLRLFLVRDSQSNPRTFVLSLCHTQKIKHFQIVPVSLNYKNKSYWTSHLSDPNDVCVHVRLKRTASYFTVWTTDTRVSLTCCNSWSFTSWTEAFCPQSLNITVHESPSEPQDGPRRLPRTPATRRALKTRGDISDISLCLGRETRPAETTNFTREGFAVHPVMSIGVWTDRL